jgi:uncharacterized repeat protein (TIGR01451 family)
MTHLLSAVRAVSRSNRAQLLIVIALVLGLLAIASAGFAVNITAITPSWSGVVGSSGTPSCLYTDNTPPTVEVRFGDDNAAAPCPGDPNVQSGLGFTSGPTGTFTNGAPFLLGELTHFNNQVFASSLLTGASLDLSFTSTAPSLPAISTLVALDETANPLQTCPYGDTAPCADRVTITPAALTFTDGGNNYQLEILGLIPGTAGTCTFSQSNLRLSFISEEDSNNSACLFGRVTQIVDSEVQITKTTTATVLQPGDIVDYQIDYNCFSTTSFCTGVQITDYLPAELEYVGSTGSIHTTSPVGTYSSAANSVLFNFIDPLPAGSTGFVRVRARVRNDGTLINGSNITNTAISTQTSGPSNTSTNTLPVTTINNWDVVKDGDATAYISTEPPITDMTYTVSICPNGSNVNLIGAQMVDTLPPNAQYVSSTGGGVYNNVTNTVTWNLGDVAASGGCVSRQVVVRFPNPPFTAGQTVTNSVTGTGTVPGHGPFTDSDSEPRTLQNFVPAPNMSLVKNTTRTDYVVGATVDYFLTPRNNGNTNLYNLVMTDTIPNAMRVTQVRTGASAFPIVLEYAINGSGTYTTWPGSPFTSNTTLNVSALGLGVNDWITSIRWRFNPGNPTPPGWQLTSPAVITGTITSPDRLGNPVNVGSQVNNAATINWQYLPGGSGTCATPGAVCSNTNGNATIDIVINPVPAFDKTSGGGVSSDQRFLIGQQVGYFDLFVDNNTGIAVDNFRLTDDIPAQFNVTSVNVGSYDNFSGTIGLRYQRSDNPGVWVNWPGTPFAEGATAPTPSLPGGVYISRIEFSYGTIPAGFRGAPRINGVTLPLDRNGNPVSDGDTMTNNATMDWTYQGSPNTRTDSTSNPIRVPTVTPTGSKTVLTGGPYIPTSAVTYRLSFGASGSSPSNVLNNPLVTDLLPLNVNYVSYTYNANGTGLPAPTFNQIPNYNGSGRTLLQWQFTGSLNRGETAYIDLNVTLGPGTPAGSLTNELVITVTDMPVNGGTTDSGDINGNGQTTDLIITATSTIPVDQLVGLDSNKGVRGELDTSYSVFPAFGRTVPNGDIDYRINIINRGNVPINNVRVVDILPFIGDTGVQDTRPRFSAWRPILTTPISAPPGVTVYYSTASNPCRPEIVPTGPSGCTAPNWTLTPPTNLDDVRSLRFDFAGTLQPGQSFTFQWQMRAPDTTAGIPDEAIAWNSFAYTSTNALTGVPLRPAEPNKVSIIYDTTPPTALIDIEKRTNTFDADLPTGPYIPTTGTVTWAFIVTNIGTTRLGNVTVTDNIEGTITCPSTILEVGASMTCTLTDPTPQVGQYANIASVIGTAIDSAGNPIDGDPSTPGVQLIQPTDSDPSHYYGYNPALGRLGDYTWIDLNYNGQQDSGEPPLGGVTVRLLDSSGNPVDDPNLPGTQDYVTTTDASGFYNFVNLPAGTYRVEFTIPSAYGLTTPNVGPDATDSDPVQTSATRAVTGTYTLPAGGYINTIDAGFIALASLGDRIWIDTNGNGIQDLAETSTPSFLTGLQLELLDGTGSPVDSDPFTPGVQPTVTFTDSAGNYLFLDLLPGSYRVRFPLPPTGYLWTTLNASGSTFTNDSDVILSGPNYRQTVTTTLDAGEVDPSWDGGLVPVASIGNYVWYDDNFNGRQDAGEAGVPGVTVRLLNSSGVQATDDNGVPIPDQVTDASGFYSFTNLRPGDYEVRFFRPTGTIFTTANASGTTDLNDSDAIESGPNIGRTAVTTLMPAENDTSWDAGLIRLASLGDFVWLDSNNNGQQNAGEPGVAGVIVTLLNATTGLPVTTDALGNPITPITTTSSGAYSFTNLDPRISYVVQFQRPAGYVFAQRDTGSDVTDSDANPLGQPATFARTGTITLAAGQNNTTIDAGLVLDASIGNFVWYDTNNNGQQDGGEGGVQNVVVQLRDGGGNPVNDENGNPIASITTPASGAYLFDGLVPGTYSIRFLPSSLPPGYAFARNDIGSDVTDSDPNRFTGITSNTTLDPGEDDLTWDAGVVTAAAIGNFVWEDVNANGLQDTGETGVANVTVRLLDSGGNPIDNPHTDAIGDAYVVTTNSAGNYSFVGLPPNVTYQVRFDRPAGFIWTRPNQGSNDAIDSDGTFNTLVTAANATTGNITGLDPGETDNDWDQGVLRPSALGNFIWRDNNDNGLQDTGEPGIDLAANTIALLDSAGNPVDNPNVAGVQNYTTDSNASGIYAFTNLYPGQYIIQFTTPSGFLRSTFQVGSGANAATDSDNQTSGPNAGRTPIITLPYNTTDNTWDAGFVPLASIGDRVWIDANNNGLQDAGESGLAGVTVTLLNAATGLPVTTDGNGNPISPIVTPGTGAYSFTNLDPRIDYIVEFSLPANDYKRSPADVGSNDAIDSDANVTTGRTGTYDLAPGQSNTTVDAGYTPLARLGDYVWIDTNGNGQQDTGEVGLNGVTVRLLDGSGNPVTTDALGNTISPTVTANNPIGGAPGYYQFRNLNAGTYIVEFTLPSGYIFTRHNTGADATDSDADRVTGRTGPYTLNWGDSNQTVDGGIVQPASLGNYVWYDANNDGIQNDGPNALVGAGANGGMNGVRVELLDGSGNPVDIDLVTPGVQNHVLTANDGSGNPGFYLFSNLIPGDYRVRFNLAGSSALPLGGPSNANYVIARRDQGGDDNLDSDPDRLTGETVNTALTAGENDLSWDAGILLRGARLGNRVWIDINNNGIQDTGEIGLNGVTVTLLNGSGGPDIDPITPGVQTLSAITAFDSSIGDGYYQFTGLVPGDYIVQVTLPAGYQFSPQDQGSDNAVDSDVNITTGRTAVITIGENGDDQTWDAGLVPLASIGNFVWIDLNDNGIQDTGEVGLNGVTVNLLDSAGNPVDNPNLSGFQPYTLTTADLAGQPGYYRFINLPPDQQYRVEFVRPAGYLFSTPDQGANDAVDSDANPTTGRTIATLLSPGEYDDTWDAGLVPLAALGDFVWIDANNNGQQDGGETGLAGVTVTLYEADGTTPVTTDGNGNPISPIVTPGTGAYAFTNLDPRRDYVVGFSLPAGYIRSAANVGPDATDSDANVTTGRSPVVALDPGQTDNTIDAGYVPLARLGDLIWNDVNGNGIQDTGETGIAGAVVTLLDGANNPVTTDALGNPIAPITTPASGAYLFTNLPAGTYRIQVTPPSGYVITRQNVGADTADSDVDRFTGISGDYVLTWGQTDLTADAGVFQPARLGNYVWEDRNYNGQQDEPAAAGVNGVTVRLLDGAGNPVDNPNTPAVDTYTVVTANLSGNPGYYLFDGLFPGTYIVEFVAPSGAEFTLANVGADASDSDANPATGRTGTYTLAANGSDLTVDAGIFYRASIGDRVWRDNDNDGFQDAGEPGVAGVTVTLYTGAGALVGTTTTDVNGNYSFTNLLPGDYYVVVTLPAGFQFSPQDAPAPADDTTDSDANPTPGPNLGRMATTTLVSGENDPTWDAGLVPLASIGDRVWNDLNGNGVQEAGENGVPNVTVRLYTSASVLVSTTTTDASGAYSFTNLPPGDYYVEFVLPPGYIFTRPDQGSDDALDSDADRFTGRTIVTTLAPGENDPTWDAGILLPAALGNYVWEDLNNDGIQNEPASAGVNGLTLTLLDSAGNPVDNPNTPAVDTYTVVTANDGGGNPGYYLFTGLFPGDYRVQFTLPTPVTDWAFARYNQGGLDSQDSDANRTTGISDSVTLAAGETNTTVDAGVLRRASIGDRVWRDDDNDGIQDAGEPGVAGVTVRLLDEFGSVVATTTTDVNGNYQFTGLVPGTYAIEVVPPTGFQFSPQDQGGDDALDSDVNFATGRTVTTQLVSGENDLTWDAGLVPLASIGDRVWNDLNGNGVQEAGENGVPNVTVRLFRPGDTIPFATTTTDASGNYLFTLLPPGDYYVEFVLPPGYIFTRIDNAGDDALDSDANRFTGRTVTTTLLPAENDLTWDAGILLPAALGNYVWEDVNDNGLQDEPASAGVNGVTVRLLDGAGNPVDNPNTPAVDTYTVVTANDSGGNPGYYLFTGLFPGDYRVEVTLPAPVTDWAFARQNQGANDAADSDVNRTTGISDSVTLAAGETNTTVDAGLLRRASIGDRVWRDNDNDGVQDMGEPGVAGVTVRLLDESGSVIATTTTDANGIYQFTGLVPGTYAIEVVLPTGFQFSQPDQGGDDALDSDVSFTTGRTVNTVLISGENDLTWDAGLVPLASIGDRVWNDLNGNGVQEAGENGVPGVTVNLTGTTTYGAPISRTTTTDASGNYLFDLLPPGDYYVEFVLPPGYIFTRIDNAGDDALDSDANRVTGRTVTTTLLPAENDLTWDAGILLPAALGNYVWEDVNDNGLQDEPASAGVNGVTVRLLDGAGNPVDNPNTPAVDTYTVVTANDSGGNPGYYLFTGLFPGDYRVEVTLPAPVTDWAFARQNQGANDAADSDVNRTTGISDSVTLAAGETNTTVDAGLLRRASIGDRVWNDLNNNGVQDAGEPGVAGVTVRLLDEFGSVVATTTTDANGIYQFTGLVPGTYAIEVVLPTGFQFSPQDQGGDDALDSDVSFTTGRTVNTVLISGENDLTWDAGLVPLASIGDRVWNDLNGNGVQEAGENGVSGVTVNLTGTTTYGAPISRTTTTDGDGNYLFDLVPPGDYYIEFVLPPGHIFTRPDQGGDDALDSDADRFTGRTVTTTLLPAENDLTWDAGILLPAALGNYVWEDVNDNGLQDEPASAGVNGVTVRLLDTSGSPVDDPNQVGTQPYIVTTNASGAYAFTGLFPGEYVVEFTLPAPAADWAFARQNQGANDAADSDADRMTGRTGTYTLIAGQTDDTADAGLLRRASIGDRVWIDLNNNGVQDGGEVGMENVTVRLLDESGSVVATTTTDANGDYQFTGLVPGTYAIEVVLPPRYQFSQPDQGGDDTADSDVNFTTGRTVNTVLISGENDLSWDAGLVPLATIGDRVWADLNNNGIQDADEVCIPAASPLRAKPLNFPQQGSTASVCLPPVTVNLLDGSGTVIATTTTDASGNYLFDLLPPGDYAIEVVLPPGYQFSPQDQGGDNALDSDVNFATGRTVTTTLLPGEDDRTWDAGLVPLATIGDRVWRDNNGNGIQDAGEPGLPGVTVNLIGTTTYGASVNRTTTTDASGNYLFTLVPPGTYQIEIVPLTPGYIVTPLNQGGDPAADSDIDPATNRTTPTVLTPGEDDRTWDAGLLPLPTIGDRVWYDNNGDGRQDPDEPGAPNVTVRLLDQNGAIVRETATDANGNYLFENVLPGQYRIAIVVPGGYTISPPNTGAADVDSDLDPETGRSPLTTLEANEIDLTWDAGLVPLGSIGDRVWNDLNGDGVQDPGEPGIPGVRIILIRPDGVEFTTTTDANGVYFFSDLPAGTYTIRVDRTTLPNGYGQTYDLTGPLDHTATYILGVGERTTAVDFGYVQLGSIGDTIWIDANRNGRVDGGERGIPGVTVRLVLPDGSTRTTTTNAQGQYVFDELFPGTYTVIVDVRTLPPGLVQVYDPDRTRDHRTTVVLGAGQNVTTADFGYARPVVGPTPPPVEPDQPEIAQPEPWQPVPACQRACVTWDMYHSNATGDWEIMRLGNLTDRPAVSPNLSQGEGATDMSPSRSPNAEWIVFASDRDGNWELYVAPTDGDSSRTQRLTFNTVAIDTDPVWGPNNFVVFESTRDGNWELYLLDMTTGDIRRLTDSPASDLNAYWSPDGTRILFQSDRSGLWQIYELNLATGAIALLSDGSADDVDPQYSETGSLIAFRSYRDGDQSSIYLMNADGSGVTRISELGGDATNAAWSPDSAYIAYQSDLDGDLDIYVYELSSGRTRKLTDNDIADYAPTWQCGTTRVIFTSDVNGEPDIYEVEALPMDAAPVDLTTDAATRLTFDPSADIYPENSPVEENASREGALPGVTLGQQTSFLQPDVSTTEADPSLDSGEAFEPVNSCETICPAWTLIHSDRTGDSEIFRLGTDGGADFNLSQGVAADDRGPTRAPNAQWIAFTSDRDGNEEIYIASADGTSIRRATNNDAADTDPVWSPDSQRLVFESDSSGNWDLYILDVQTGVETQITRDPADDRNADWSAAGNSIVFESTRDGRSQIYVYDLRTGETRRLVETTGAATNPVYSSSGTMIAFTHVEPDGKTAVYVVQQDGSGLTRISEPAPNAGAPEWYFDDTLITYQSDLDGDLDVYVYDFATGQTRKLTDNTVADYAPTWRCGAPEVIFTSDVTGNPDIFRAEALPIDRPAIDVQTDALQLTDNPARDRFPVGAPNDEEVSRIGM